MKRVLVDSKDNIVYEGIDAREVMDVLLKEPSDVTEEDEIKYNKALYNTVWEGQLRYEVHFDLKFRGIDDWNRPVFKDVNSTLHFGSVNKLFDWDTPKESIIEFFRAYPEELEYFGDKFPCEPHGGKADNFKFNIIE